MTAGFIDSTGGDGWAYLTDRRAVDRLVRIAVAEQADRVLTERINFAMWGGARK